MRAEREREATDERARGNEAAQRIRAQADRTVVELVSEAQREAEIVRGEADALRNGIFAEAFGRDPEFFEFYRSLTAYSRALRGENSSMVLSPDSEFFNYLGSAEGAGRGTLSSLPASSATPDEAAAGTESEEPQAQEAETQTDEASGRPADAAGVSPQDETSTASE